MVKLKGIHLVGDDMRELHSIANYFGVGKSWLHINPYLYYDVINPIIHERIYRFLNSKKYIPVINQK